jgi:xylose isomerase
MANPFPKISTHLGYFGTGGDRYNPPGYKQAASPADRIRLVSQVDGLDGVELNYPALVNEETVDEIRSVLSETKLAVSSVSLNVWGAGKWGLGSLSSPDPATRADALDTMKRGIEVARAVGSRLVSLWPGQDGFDYPFQTDYGAAYDWFIAGVQKAAAHDRGMRLCLEYKPKEPRTHLLVDSAARAMWLVGKIGAPNVGVLLDLGHALLAYENMAQSAVLLQREGLLDLLHFNDNYGEWDWDMIPGTLRFWENIELIFWLRKLGYDKWYSIDIAMPRGDAVKACQLSVTNIRRFYRLAEKLDSETISANLQHTDQLENLRLVSDAIFSALDA